MPRNDRTGPVGERADVAYQPEGHIGLPVPTRTRPMPPARLPADLPGYALWEPANGHPQRIMDYPHRGMRQRRSRTFSADTRKETRAEGIDGIRAYTHNYGCSQLGDDHGHAARLILRDMALHPNAGGVLMTIGRLRSNQPDAFRALLGEL